MGLLSHKGKNCAGMFSYRSAASEYFFQQGIFVQLAFVLRRYKTFPKKKSDPFMGKEALYVYERSISPSVL